MRILPVLLLTAMVCGVLVCGCTVPTAPASQPAAPAPQAIIQTSAVPIQNGPVKNIDIIQRSFDPQTPPPFSPGTTVVWTNRDQIVHRVVHMPQVPSEKELFNSGPLYPGDTFSYTFTKAGEYYYDDPQIGTGTGTPKIIIQ